jgi:hypothetical protein
MDRALPQSPPHQVKIASFLLKAGGECESVEGELALTVFDFFHGQ